MIDQALQDESSILERLTDLVVRLAQTPAPTFEEEKRADLLTGMWRDAGLAPERDGVGNVVATVPGGRGPTVLVAAHLDSVFPRDIDVTILRNGDRLEGPGVGDNATSLAVMTHYLTELPAHRPRLVVAATVGEEGAGDLRGARRVVDDWAGRIDHFVALDGHLGSICHQGVGSKRFEVTFSAAGGHSWGDYPSPSAIHTAAEAVARLARLSVPTDPRSSLNVGLVWGGTSVNSIAASAGFALDLRSVDQHTLDLLWEASENEIRDAAERSGCAFDVKQIGDRPAGASGNDVLVATAREALDAAGVKVSLAAASTDANAAMARGISAISFGAYRGGGAHTLGEWVDASSLTIGLRALTDFLGRLADGP
ncbi:MAG TPA: M20/M25/M40 family metallo-hydrolase [Trueperaceae bacterium]|nr:M20/M25/M40 family metallo-hydrolase [Trueperaceae bacterium]